MRQKSEPVKESADEHPVVFQLSVMPRGPKGEKRPADVIGNAVQVMRIAAGEIEDIIPDDGKDPAAKALGKKGALGRAAGGSVTASNSIPAAPRRSMQA
jgi:hypothetical protein